MYEDGAPGEIFIKMAKEGSTLSGFMDGFALSVSIGCSTACRFEALVDKFVNTRFEPSGYTGNPEHPLRQVGAGLHRALARREIHLARLSRYRRQRSAGASRLLPPQPPRSRSAAAAHRHRRSGRLGAETSTRQRATIDDAPTCSECGMLMTPNGSCYKCANCGGTSGCS